MPPTGEPFLRSASATVRPLQDHHDVIDELHLDLLEWAADCGYRVHSWRHHLTTDVITVTAVVTRRDDGEWPSIHAAVDEDALDRALRRDPPIPPF